VADEQETAGAALTFLRDRILFDGDPPPSAYREFDRMAGNAPPGSHGVIFTPWLYGERTPVEDHCVRGGVHNPAPSTPPRRPVPGGVRGGGAEYPAPLRGAEK